MTKTAIRAEKTANAKRLERWNDGAGTKRRLKRDRTRAQRRAGRAACQAD